MDYHDSGSHNRTQKRKGHRNVDDKIEYLFSGEKQLLQSISGRTPLPKVLNGICNALDSHIGNVVSLISLPWDDRGELAAIAMNAALFGLYTFCSEGVVAENNEMLGSLEMYSSVPRSPSAGEYQWIERAKCLAAIAIKLRGEAQDHRHSDMQGNRPVRGRVLEWPALPN